MFLMKRNLPIDHAFNFKPYQGKVFANLAQKYCLPRAVILDEDVVDIVA